jgi:hypothetical protein
MSRQSRRAALHVVKPQAGRPAPTPTTAWRKAPSPLPSRMPAPEAGSRVPAPEPAAAHAKRGKKCRRGAGHSATRSLGKGVAQ